MKSYVENHIFISSFLILVSLSIAIGSWFVNWNQGELEKVLREELRGEHATLIALADITDRNGADEVIESIVRDCPRRNEFEALLVRLDKLSSRELIALQTLYESCGSFYAERKALMVSRLEREYTSYVKTLSFLRVLTTHDTEKYHDVEWNELISLEKSRSTLLTDQKDIQEKIIVELIRGESVQGKVVNDLAREAQDVAELLSVTDKRINEKRSQVNM